MDDTLVTRAVDAGDRVIIGIGAADIVGIGVVQRRARDLRDADILAYILPLGLAVDALGGDRDAMGRVIGVVLPGQKVDVIPTEK